jgi:hypothetical protein
MDLQLHSYVLVQLTFEIRYRQGYRYLDRCGDILVRIENSMPGWTASDVNLNTGTLENREQAMKYVFGPANAAMTQARMGITSGEPFLKHTAALLDATLDGIKPASYSRAGLRSFDLRGVASAKEGIELMNRSEYLRSVGDVHKLLGKQASGRNLAYRAEDDKSGLILRVATVKRTATQLDDDIPFEEVSKPTERPAFKEPSNQARIRVEQLRKKRDIAESPSLGVLVDLDCFEKDPREFRVIEFLERGFAQRRRILDSILPK